MDEYISREAIIKELKKEIKACDIKFVEDGWIKKGLKIALKDIKAVKAANVQFVVDAKWEISSDGYYPYCSRCFERPNGELTKYCPNCGARMDLKDGDTNG